MPPPPPPVPSLADRLVPLCGLCLAAHAALALASARARSAGAGKPLDLMFGFTADDAVAKAAALSGAARRAVVLAQARGGQREQTMFCRAFCGGEGGGLTKHRCQGTKTTRLSCDKILHIPPHSSINLQSSSTVSTRRRTRPHWRRCSRVCWPPPNRRARQAPLRA
jgi:hypothetical protein